MTEKEIIDALETLDLKDQAVLIARTKEKINIRQAQHLRQILTQRGYSENLVILFVEGDTKLETLTDEELREKGLQRITKDNIGG
jgi:hypothetical protein